MKKRLISAIVSLCMLLTMVPTVAFAADNESVTPVMSGTCGENVTWNFNADSGTLTISGEGAMEDFSKQPVPWASQSDNIKHVVIKSGVTTIGSNSFMSCENLKSVSIPEGVTTIGDRAFSQSGLKSIVIPASVTMIGPSVHEVFYQCYNLENITVKSGNTVYKSIDGVLYTADGTTLIQYPQNKADTSYKMIDTATNIEFLAINYTQNLKTIDFNNVTTVADKGVYGNKALEEIVLPKVTTIGARAFCGNKAVTSLTLQTVPTSVGENAFSSCTSLVNVNLPDEMTVLSKGMFAGCTGLKSVKFPAQLTKIDYGCFDNAGLTGDLVIPESVTSIGDLAFRRCYGLTSITVEGTPTFEGQGFAFQFCNNLLWMKANFNITKYFGNISTPDQYKEAGLQPQNSSWFTADGKEVNSRTEISQPTIFYRWFTKKVALSANGGENSGNITEVYAFFAPALGENATIQFPSRYYRGQVNYVVNVDNTSFTRDGYTFKEWTGDAAGTKPYAIGKYIYNYVPDTIYAQWEKKIGADTYFVYPSIEDQTYTSSELKPAVKVTKNNEVITEGFTVEYSNNTNVGTATATVKVNNEVIGTATFNIVKATPTVNITADKSTLTGSGTVKLTVSSNGVPAEGNVEVTCDNDITVTKNGDGTFTAALPNATKTYTFTASYAGDDNHESADKSCKVSVTRRSSSGGGSSSDSIYAVSVPSAKNGDVTVSPQKASKGDNVTITVKPDGGYQLDELTVTDKNGNALKLTDKGNGLYTFTMPAGKVEVNATFAKKIETSPFSDVSTNDGYYEAVKWAQEKGITGGIGGGLFGPNQPCTRAQIVSFLWRAAGSPEPKNMSSFSDVSADSYYAKAVAWAIENGITSGTGDGKFSPDVTCTRAQSVTFLYRAFGAPAVSGSTTFSDVPADTYYTAAVKWAAENGITGGIGGGLFGSDNDCTRAQIVTFLYRAYQK